MYIINDHATIYAYKDYRVILIETYSEYEAWIQHENVGLIDHMFSEPKEQETWFEFLETVEANLEDSIKWYEESYL